MAYRGRGRGRGRGGFGSFGAKPEQFILFPEDVKLPDISSYTPEDLELASRNMKLQNYWNSSPYYLEEPSSKKSQDIEIERYSDRRKPRNRGRYPLSYHLKLTPNNFPQELIAGTKRVEHDQRKIRWNPDSGLQKLDMFEKLEQKFQGKDEEKKESDDDDEEVDLEDEEYSDDGDYNQNVDFDDDEDDFNMDDGGEDEATF